MISYDKFEEYMLGLKRSLELDKKLNDVLREYSNDFGGFANEDLTCMIIDMLKNMTNDESEWIEYYIFELDWGNDYEDGDVTDEEDNIIKLKTIKDLYTVLEEEYEINGDEDEEK